MSKQYIQHSDGEWIQPSRHNYRIACCDCGLVHRIDIRVIKRRVQFRAFRDSRATTQRRRTPKGILK